MKKIYSYLLLLMMLPIVAMMQSCDEEEIVFESDIPRFELRGDRILLEALVPSNTPVGDEMYIVGAINGGDVDAVVGNPVWQLEKAADYDYRYGIYLDPATFAEGTSLADGYYIYSASQREERTLKGDSVMHSADAGLGERITINVNRWASYFSAEEAPVHDGYAIYVIDNSGYDALALYAYGDGEIFGVWPGILPTGTEVVDGTEYIYFDAGEANSGMSVNLIFNNNNNGSQLADFPVVLDRDYYLELTPDGVVEIDQSATIEHDGYAIFFEDLTGWDALYMYAWVDGNPSICGEWPGVTPTGEVTINGVNYKYFDTGAANVGQVFSSDKYFWGRPSNAGDGYDAASSAGSNKGPTNEEYLAEVETRIDSFLVHHPYLQRKDVPAEMVTASASGLDPHITPQSAYIQVKRVAEARGMSEDSVKAIVDGAVEKPLLNMFGPAKVNVLKLNVALDKVQK